MSYKDETFESNHACSFCQNGHIKYGDVCTCKECMEKVKNIITAINNFILSIVTSYRPPTTTKIPLYEIHWVVYYDASEIRAALKNLGYTNLATTTYWYTFSCSMKHTLVHVKNILYKWRDEILENLKLDIEKNKNYVLEPNSFFTLLSVDVKNYFVNDILFPDFTLAF